MAVSYTNTTIEYGLGTSVTVDANASLTVDGPLTVSGDTSLNAVDATGKIDVEVAGTPTQAIGIRRSADADDNFFIYGDGGLAWGTGAAVYDTNLYRPSANKLQTDDTFNAALDVQVSGVSLPRGIASYNRIVADSPSAGTTASTKATAALVITTTAAVFTGRLYQIVSPALSVRMNGAARTGVFVTYTIDLSTPTQASAGAGEQYVNCPTAGSPVPVPISCLYAHTAANATIKVALWIWNVSGGGSTVANGTGGGTTTPIELMVMDIGADPGAQA